MSDSTSRAQNGMDTTRRWIAIWMVITGVTLLAVVSAVAIGFAGEADRPEMARLVFASTVPLVGTWVGAVLAFYFARENLQAASESQRAATESTLELVGRLAPTTPVTAVMIAVGQIDPKEIVADDAAARVLKLGALYRRMRDRQRSRVPIFDAAGVALYVVHEPDIDKYAQSVQQAADALGDEHTLERLLADAALEKAIRAFTAVAPEADVGAARAQLSADPELKDIFVTVGGRPEDKALGWITASDIARVD